MNYTSYSLLLNCEKQCLKLINFDLYKLFAPFWKDIMYFQAVIVSLVRAGMNIFPKFYGKILWIKRKSTCKHRLIYSTKTQNKAKQQKKLEMSARKQISMEVKNTAKPNV